MPTAGGAGIPGPAGGAAAAASAARLVSPSGPLAYRPGSVGRISIRPVALISSVCPAATSTAVASHSGWFARA